MLARRRVFSRVIPANHHLQVLASSSNEFMLGCNKVRVFLQISLTVDDIKRKETSRKILTVQIFQTVEVARQTALTTLHRRFLLQ